MISQTHDRPADATSTYTIGTLCDGSQSQTQKYKTLSSVTNEKDNPVISKKKQKSKNVLLMKKQKEER